MLLSHTLCFIFLGSSWHNSQPQVQNGMYPFQRVSNAPGFQPQNMESKNKKANIIKEIRSQSQKTWKPRHKQKQSQIPQSQKESKQHPSKCLCVYEFEKCEIAEKEI